MKIIFPPFRQKKNNRWLRRNQKSIDALWHISLLKNLVHWKTPPLAQSMWRVKDLLVVYERRSREDDTSETAVSLTDNGWPGSIWMQQPWTNMMYTSSLAQWVPSIPPSPWWPTATASQGPQPQSNYHLAIFILPGCKQKHSGMKRSVFAIILFVPHWPVLHATNELRGYVSR